MLTTEDLFNREVDFEERLARLIEWVDRKRGVPTLKAEARLLAHLLATDAVAIPLHLVFPGEVDIDLSLRHPTRRAEADPIVDEASLLNFIWRHTELTPETIEQLQDCARKYEAIIGLVGWDAAFESEEAYKQALANYEIVASRGVEGEILHEDEVFWYVASRDYGINRHDADVFNRHVTIYLFALGIATDDVGITVLE